jgi:hypothetical protein
MRSIQVELETITPLFLSGADQEVAELRAPAFRGALRYWLRALLGGQQGTESIQDVSEAEAKVFGSTSSGSPVGVRLIGRPETQHWYPPHLSAASSICCSRSASATRAPARRSSAQASLPGRPSRSFSSSTAGRVDRTAETGARRIVAVLQSRLPGRAQPPWGLLPGSTLCCRASGNRRGAARGRG